MIGQHNDDAAGSPKSSYGSGGGGIEELPDSEPPLTHQQMYDDSLQKKKNNYSEEEEEASPTNNNNERNTIEYIPDSEPITNEQRASLFDDSLDKAAQKEQQQQQQQSGNNMTELIIDEENVADAEVVTADARVTLPSWGRDQSVFVPEAQLVEEKEIPSATVVEPDKFAVTVCGRKIRWPFIALGIIIIFAAAITAGVIASKRGGGVGGGGDELAPSSSPSISLSPSLNPSPSPSNSPSSYLQVELSQILTSAGVDMSSFTPSHEKAFSWLTTDLSAQGGVDAISSVTNRPYSADEIVERFILALIYYETDGPNWQESSNFLSTDHVCYWVRKRSVKAGLKYSGIADCSDDPCRATLGACTNEGRVMGLELDDNKLTGDQLPTEIGLLSQLNYFNVGSNAGIGGILPDTLGYLSNLSHLDVSGNIIQGNLPASLDSLGNLTYLDVSDNRFRGPLIEVNNLTKLEQFKAENNYFEGDVPKSFGRLPQLETLYLQENQLKGDVNFLCQDLPSEYELDCYESNPEIICNCCVGCTFVNKTGCKEDEKMIYINILAGSSDFEWKLGYDEPLNTALIAAGGKYSHRQQLDIQICVKYPAYYLWMTSSNDVADESNVTITIDSLKWTLATPDHVLMEVWKDGAAFVSKEASDTQERPELDDEEVLPVPLPGGGDEALDRPPFIPSSKPTFGATFADTFGSTPTVDGSSRPTFGSTLAVSGGATTRPTEVLGLPSPTDSDCLLFDLSIKTDAFGQETSWEVVNTKNNSIVLSNSSLPSNQIVKDSECLDRKGCYEFVIRDTFNDGICCGAENGNYNVSINSKVVGSGGQFGSSETTFLGGNCAIDVGATNVCPDQYFLLNVTILADDFGEEISWQMTDASTNQILAVNENDLVSNVLLSVTKCVPIKDCYLFSLYDSAGDGLFDPGFWIVELDGKDVFSGGSNEFNGWSKSKSFGPNCPG